MRTGYSHTDKDGALASAVALVRGVQSAPLAPNALSVDRPWRHLFVYRFIVLCSIFIVHQMGRQLSGRI
jgi:hypothetical protein